MTPDTTSSAIAILTRLVAFDTTSHKSNRDLVSFVEAYLADHGITSHLVPTEDGEKASLFATIGPDDVPGIGLSGHTDVVPTVPADWTSDPYLVREEAGRLYGRGTTDMKGYLACVLALVPEYKRRALKIPIHILFSYDEETGCTGVRPMIAELGERLAKPRLVIVGEPTNMTVVDAHKGPMRWRVDVAGHAAHSSMAPLGVNAIAIAAELIAELNRIENELKTATRDDRFLPPYATLQVTEISGGTASNIVPAACHFGFEIRTLAGLDVEAIEQRLNEFAKTRFLADMQRVAPEAGISIHRVNSVPPFAAGPSSEAVALALKLAQQNETYAVSYATEAGLFQVADVPAVVCGPGDIAQAHTADEWIAISEIERCLAFLSRLADWAEG